MENDIDPLRFVTLRQAAEMLHISPHTVMRMARNKELPVFKVGGQWRARESELAKWLERVNER
jgi:excisionase family DNA binding protein